MPRFWEPQGWPGAVRCCDSGEVGFDLGWRRVLGPGASSRKLSTISLCLMSLFCLCLHLFIWKVERQREESKISHPVVHSPHVLNRNPALGPSPADFQAVCISRKLESGVKSGEELGHSSGGWGTAWGMVRCYAKCLLYIYIYFFFH